MRDEQFTVALDSGREVSFEPDKFRHIDHGYAVTSYSSQSQTVDRVLINADANESDLLLNQRMGYVAISRARADAIIFTNSSEQLRTALNRSVDKEMAVEALRLDQNRNAPSQEQRERLVSPLSKEATLDPDFERELMNDQDTKADERATAEEIEQGINS